MGYKRSTVCDLKRHFAGCGGQKGDSVLTSPLSYNYPPGYLIGRIATIETDKASGFYLLKLRTAVNFNAIQQAFIVENLQREEQLKLDEETKRKIDQQKS